MIFAYRTIMASKKALVLLADGAEEMEAVITIDVLRRAKIDTTVASVGNETNKNIIHCSRDVRIVADLSIGEASEKGPFDVVILPGGLKGAQNLGSSEAVKAILTQQYAAGRMIAAICAAPTALLAHGIAKGRTITSYPSFKDALKVDYNYSDNLVVVDGNIVTSQGPGTCFPFALKLVELLVDETTAKNIQDGLLLIK